MSSSRRAESRAAAIPAVVAAATTAATTATMQRAAAVPVQAADDANVSKQKQHFDRLGLTKLRNRHGFHHAGSFCQRRFYKNAWVLYHF